MTTDEVQQTGSRRPTTNSDEFSSENYVQPRNPDAPDESDTVILGVVPGSDDAFDNVTAIDTSSPQRSVEPAADADPAPAADDADGAKTDDGNESDGTESDGTNDDSDDDGDESDGTDDTTETDQAVDGALAEDDVDEDQADGGGSSTGPPDEDAAESDNRALEGYIEMRQVAGLTAGSMMKLTRGRAFEFNESNQGGSFSLRVLENGEVVVHPGSAHAVLDEVEVTEPMLVGEALLNVSSACFSVRRPRPPATSESRMESVGAAFASVSAITVPPLGAEAPLPPDELGGSRLGTIINRNPLTRGAVGQNAWDFLQSVRQARAVVAERHRLMHPDPEELKTRLSRLDPGLWERSRQHPLFGRFGVGYAGIPWEPRFDNPELIPEVLHEPIVEMSLLPWVPVTANLLYGPLGIVGKRAARLAACRHVILSLAALSMPGELQFAIRSGKNTATSWNWARALPPILSVDENDSYVVTVIDGADGARLDEAARQEAFEQATETEVAVDPAPTADVPVVQAIDDRDPDDLDVLSSVEKLTPGYIVLAETLDELTQPCGTVLQIEPDGTGSVTNHLNETIQVTPIGVTEAFAHDMATRIADILTDSFL